ncbi:MAG: S8 family serine peptidase [Fidelibacterota bacterium]
MFFSDKNATTDQYIHLSEKTISRRQKMNKDYTWYDRQISIDYIQAVSKIGVTIHRQSNWLNAVSVSGTNKQIQKIYNLPFVNKIQPVARFVRKNSELFTPSFNSKTIPTDTSFYGFAWEQMDQINCNTAHDAGYFGQGIRVLILDTGFNTELSVFDSLNIVDEWDFINNDGNTANETDDALSQHNHGTMVFSAMAGYDPGNLVGPAYGAEFLLAKTEDVTSESIVEEDNYVAALEWGEQNGADIASSSLGYLDWYSYCDMDGNTAVTTNAVDIAVNLGMVCVTSAGNWGTSSPPPNPCDTLYYYISAPADADSVIAVGAVNSEGLIASFSSHGPTHDGRIKPEICARGVSTWCTQPNSNSYRTASGTSLAAPLVGGAAAVILSANPGWTPMQVREAMIMTADKSDIPDNDYGYGVIDVMAAIDYVTNSIDKEIIPNSYSIINVYPNPFNSTATILLTVDIKHKSQLRIYDINGRLVEILLDEIVNPGKTKIEWNAANNPSGLYILQLKTKNNIYTKKITHIK